MPSQALGGKGETMGAFTTSEFTALLDELIAKTEADERAGSRPSVPFGFVGGSETMVDDFWSSVPSDVVASLYDTGRETIEAAPGMEMPEPVAPLPSTDPADIAAELQMAHARWPRDFDRIRREFALRNHPDRVESRLRERAVIRMQIANMLIDQEKRKAAGRR